MNTLSKNKRNQLILVILLSVGVLAALWFGLVTTQQQKLVGLGREKIEADRRLREVQEVLASADQVEEQLGQQSNRLAVIEANMATGDLYSWVINTLRQFKLSYKVEIPQFSQIDGPKEMNMLAGFPYKQATITVSGTALFYDFGKFLADFENQFPYMRVVHLTLEPVAASAGNEKERLAFKMEIATLVKPVSS